MSKLFIAIFLLVALFATPFVDIGSVASAQGNQAHWEAVIEMSSAQLSYAQNNSSEMSSSMLAKGVTARITAASLELSGSQGIEQLRSVLFDETSKWVDFLGGPVDLTLILPSGDTSVSLRLESRLTAGYKWDVLVSSQARYVQNGDFNFEMRYPGYGAPAIQTIALQSGGIGTGTVHLIYRRPFEKDAPIHARVQITLTKISGTIELNDPTPTPLTVSGDPNQGNDNTDPYADLLPKALPASWDWRAHGIVPPIRDQGGCGSCWAFGTVGVMESAVKKGGGPLTDLSEQFLISCNKDGWDCDGGLTASKYHFNTLGKAQNAVGAVLESVKPYTESNGSCSVVLPHPFKANSWQFIVPNEWTMPTVTQIKNAIYTYGPVTAGICAGNAFDDYTPGTIFSTDETSQCPGTTFRTNHQIVLVGWNDATQSWILRNSWNTNWGNSGYMNIKWNTSRVGEGTSWVKYLTNTPIIPTAYTPTGDTYTRKPTYSWSMNSAVSSYKLRVKDVAAGTYPINGITISNSFCNATTNRCSYSPATFLAYNKTYQWQVAAGSGAYTALKSFKPLPGFSSQFNGNSNGWVKRPGGTWANSASTYYTTGAANRWSTISFNQSFGNFTFQVRMKRISAGGSPSGLVVRGTPVFGDDNSWNSAYIFLYSQRGTFSVWKRNNGILTELKPWTTSLSIAKNTWNTLKVVTYGSQLRFYINGRLLWSGVDTSFKTGQVGMGMYRDSTVERMDVDWATLSMPDLFTASEEIESGQVQLTGQGGSFFQSPLP